MHNLSEQPIKIMTRMASSSPLSSYVWLYPSHQRSCILIGNPPASARSVTPHGEARCLIKREFVFVYLWNFASAFVEVSKADVFVETIAK